MRRARNPTMSKSSSWPKQAKTVVKKWLNLSDSGFHSDDDCRTIGSTDERSCVGGAQRRRKSCSDRDGGSLLARTTHLPSQGGWLAMAESSDSENLRRRPPPPPPPPPGRYGSPAPTSSWRPPKDLRIFVGTWNVGGRAPHGGLDLADWLLIHDGPASSSPHIYVLGFQEIVPLNAGNVLGAEERGPARKWLDLIRRALNPCSAAGPAGSRSSRSRRRSPSGRRVSFSDLLAAGDGDDDDSRPSTASSSWEPDYDDDLASEPSSTTTPSSSCSEEEPAAGGGGDCYRLAASKQMVGVLLCVWVRADAARCVAGVAASRVGTGVLGYMGNKGAVSVSLALRGGAAAPAPALCFVCTHLASGDRPGDEARRNGDVAEILRRTKFAKTRFGGSIGRPPPETILEHDKVIWLGDLNYRLAAGNGGARELVERKDWEALLERDQLRAEQSAGRVFAGWEEGRIRFPPTYKYVAESDAYAINDDDCSSSGSGGGSRPREKNKKKRTPAWCDRILWRGEGMQQHWYARGESRFSDHRPVSTLFSARLHDAAAGDEGTMTAAGRTRCAAAEAEKKTLMARCRRTCCPPPPPHSSRF
ncbi:hypothetical protein BS78_09G015700 [Paspalum vaginatum]|nr:hypothetical protein BS78_09G015700 [Paspalum vaginatum]KAJ1261267.1 hypothetical protein BS78_09G015700 [Paspalum vaginatum]KAJ1261268.1 hypothetical protein BS78_09G015700 [Paspalum vaginatum]